MNKRVRLLSIIIIVMCTVVQADWNVDLDDSSLEVAWGLGYVNQYPFGISFMLDPHTIVVIGYLAPDIGVPLGPGGAIDIQDGYIISVQTTDLETQSTYLAGRQTSFVVGDGVGSAETHIYVIVVQTQ